MPTLRGLLTISADNAPGAPPAGGSAVVCIHDVCPAWLAEVEQLLHVANACGVACLSMAIIPQPSGRSWGATSAAERMLRLCREHGNEFLLHGLTHMRPPGSRSLLSWWIGGFDEFARLSPAEAERRVALGQSLITDLLGRPAFGFLPPAWRGGAVERILPRTSLRFVVGLDRIIDRDGRGRPLATWSWDGGRFASVGRLTDLAGSLLSRIPRAVPCIALHPRDIARGYLPLIEHRMRHLIRSGRKFCRFEDLLKDQAHRERTDELPPAPPGRADRPAVVSAPA